MSKQVIRSPSYPSIPLDAALQAVSKIEERYRTAAVAREDAARLIGYSGLSGPANKALAAMAAYGLLERAGKGDTRVTERARDIIHPNSPEEKRACLMAAASAPPLFQNLRERYPDISVPPHDGVVTYLNRQNFNPNAVRQAAKAFLRTAEYLQEQGVSDSHETESSNERESPLSEDAKDTPLTVLVDDLVQWESQGVQQFPQPRRVRAISDDGNWALRGRQYDGDTDA